MRIYGSVGRWACCGLAVEMAVELLWGGGRLLVCWVPVMTYMWVVVGVMVVRSVVWCGGVSMLGAMLRNVGASLCATSPATAQRDKNSYGWYSVLSSNATRVTAHVRIISVGLIHLAIIVSDNYTWSVAPSTNTLCMYWCNYTYNTMYSCIQWV